MKNQGKNKILLINTVPASLRGEIKEFNLPLGLLSIATWLIKKSNFKVKFIDCLVEDNWEKILENEIKQGDVLIAGMSVMSSCVPHALETTRLIKRLDSKIKIVWGGVHCKLYPIQTVKHPLIDFVVYREGEIPILNIANALISNKSFKKIKGISFKEEGKAFINEPEEYIDLNEIGIMNYELLNPKIFKTKNITLNTSRGCPHRCTFCVNVATGNRKWRFLTPENVVKQVEHLIKNYGIEMIYFRDETFFVDGKRAEKIFDLILKKKIKLKIIVSARFDYFGKGIITQKLLYKMKRAGVYNVGCAFEFGNQKMRDFIKKDITEEDIIKGVKMLKKAGLGLSSGVMTGTPTETKEDTLATVRLIKKMTKLYRGLNVIRGKKGILEWRDNVRIAGPQIYRPYPGGELFDYVVKNYGWKTPETLEGWEKYFKENTRYRIEDYTWLEKSPSYYAALQFYISDVGRLSFLEMLKKFSMPYPPKYKILLLLFYPFARIRTLLDFYDLPIEYLIGKKTGFLDKLEI